MFVAEMTINGVPPFKGEVGFKFDKRINVFVGPNASGKSTLLGQLLRSYNSPDISARELSYVGGQPVYLARGENCVLALEDEDDDYDHSSQRFNVIIVPAVRARYGFLRSKVGLVTASELHAYYGVDSLSDALYEDHIQSTISALQRVIQSGPIDGGPAIEGREYADYELLPPFVSTKAEEDPQKAWRGLQGALIASHSCAKDICREVISGNEPLHERAVREVESASGMPDLDAHLELGVRVSTTDRGVSSLNMTSLSAGTEGTLWWTRLIALSLLFMQEFEPGWQNRRAILLIDEIENHLHPTWQRRVIPALLQHFPGLQIFATTHSPFVVVGLKKGQVHRLHRDQEGIIRAEPPNDVDIMGWTMDEILRGFMDVPDPTDDETARHAAELRRLRDEGPRADEREEGERLERIQELRRLVDRDLLAGGPMAARREAFEQQFNEALENYRQSRDLGQDNG